MVRNTNFCEEGVQLDILPSLVGLKGKDFSIKLSFDKFLEVMKFLKNFRLMFYKIDPCELTEIINETNVVFLSSYGFNGRTLNIRENKFQRKF